MLRFSQYLGDKRFECSRLPTCLGRSHGLGRQGGRQLGQETLRLFFHLLRGCDG
jgi:hypothetical protein